MSKEIRFINSRYDDMFCIPDGATIQIEFSDEKVIKVCRYIDDYHARIGSDLFHICQFAEMMERVGAKYYPEDEIMDEQAAWKVGQNHYLALQASEDGYDYTLYDACFNEIDGGQLDDPELSMKEARKGILNGFRLGGKDLAAVGYDELMEKTEQVEAERFASVLEKLNSHRRAILENKQPSEMFFDGER